MAPKAYRMGGVSRVSRTAHLSAGQPGAARPPRVVKDLSPASTGTNVFAKAVMTRAKHKTT
jgi:hypothetical protein